MQVETKKPCGACAAENAPEATYCWRCYAAFPPALPPAPGAGTRPGGATSAPAWGTTGPIGQPEAPPKRRPLLRTAAGVVVALAVLAGALSLLHDGPSLPDSVAGRSRLDSAEASRFQDEMQQQADKWDLQVQAGVYGTNGAPSMFVILVEGAAIETTDQLYDSFVSGMEQSGAQIDRDAVASGERAGTEYRCVPIDGQVQAVACMWRDDDNVGIVLGLDETAQSGVDLLFATHEAALD